MYFIHVYMCIYFQKKIQDFQIFPKKREKFSKKKKKKSLWTRGIEPLSHLKKKIEIGALDFLVTFLKKKPIFFFQRFQDSLKSSFRNGT